MHRVKRLFVWIVLCSLPGAATASCLRPGSSSDGVPEWKLKLILGYPVRDERPNMLYSTLAEHYAVEQIDSPDAESLVRLLVPGMLEAKAPPALAQRIRGAMELLSCGRVTAAQEAPAKPDESVRLSTPKPADATSMATARRALVLPTALPDRASSDTQGQATPTTSTEMLAVVASKKEEDEKLKAAALASNEAVRELKKNAAAIKGTSPMPECCKGNESTCAVGNSPCVSLAARTEDTLLAMRRSYEVTRQANMLATSPGASGPAAEQIKTDFVVAKPLLEFGEGIGAARLPRYGIYAGPSYTLKGDGGWYAGSEFVARFESAVHDHSRACLFGSWCRTASEFSYRSIGQLDDDADPVAANRAHGDDDEPTMNPFTSKGGIFRYTGAYQTHFNDWFGLMAVAGLTAVDAREAKQPELRTRVGIGGHFQTLYGDGALGQVYFGYMRDAIWEREVPIDPTALDLGMRKEKNNDRWVIDGLFFLPGIDVGGFQVAARLTADAPINRRGPSDVRASLLFHYDLNSCLRKRDPRKAKDETP